MKTIISLGIGAFAVFTTAFAQQITHGPVVGAVTENSCKIYVRTVAPAQVKILLSLSKNLNDVLITETSTSHKNDQSVIVQQSNLQPNTQYYCFFKVNDQLDTVSGSFKTFPKVGEPGDYTLWQAVVKKRPTWMCSCKCPNTRHTFFCTWATLPTLTT